VRSLIVWEDEEGGAVQREAHGTPEPWETDAGFDAPGQIFNPDAGVQAVGRHHQLGALLRALPDERARLRSIGRLPPEMERRWIRVRAAAIIAWLVSFTFVAVFFVLRRPPGGGNLWIPLAVFPVLFVLGRIGKPRRPYVSPPVRSRSSGG